MDIKFCFQNRSKSRSPCQTNYGHEMDTNIEREAPEGTKAKARLVAKGFTDPDLLTIRAEAPYNQQNWKTLPYSNGLFPQ